MLSIINVEVLKMTTKTEKLFYTLGEGDFQKALLKRKGESSTFTYLLSEGNELFYAYSPEEKEQALSFEKALWDLNATFSSFTSFAQQQIVQSLLIEEIESTNEIEGVHSTRHDIFSLLHNEKANASSKKIVAMVNSYSLLLSNKIKEPNSLADLRVIYDELLTGAIDKGDAPDGRLFRKGPVSVVGSTSVLHKGVMGENNVEKAMSAFLSTYHNVDLSFLERILVSHYLFESIHPFYDGNGRMGRFLISIALESEKDTIFAYLVSIAINKSKSKYYKAFKSTEAVHNFGDLSAFVDPMSIVFIKEANDFNASLLTKKKESDSIFDKLALSSFSRSEAKVVRFLIEGSLWSDYGVNNQEIIKETGLSKRTLLYTLKKLRAMQAIEETKFGAITYHRIKH